MKCLLLLWMLAAVSLMAADRRPAAGDPLSRLIGKPQAVNTTVGFEAVEQRHPFRRVNGKEADLRQLFSWINRGKVIRGKRPFTQECPAADWHPVNGTIVSVMDDAVLVSLPLSRNAVFIKNYPKDLNPTKGGDVAVVAVEAGTFDYEAGVGRRESVKVYDYGVPFTPAVLPATNVVDTTANLPRAQPKPAKRQ